MDIENNENLNRIKEDYRSINRDTSYDINLYHVATDLYLNSNEFMQLNDEQKEQIKGFFTQLQSSMNSPEQPGKFKIPNQFYLDVWKDAISSFSYINPEDKRGTRTFDYTFERYSHQLEYVESSDNRFDSEVGNLLWDIYNRDDISIGVHGSILPDDMDISPDNCDFFKHGIMVDEKYRTGDARRTVNFQDLPGVQYSMGRVSFLRLLNYEYKSLSHSIDSDKPLANYSVIVVRPSAMKDTSYDENNPQELSIVSPSTFVKTNDGNYLHGHLIKPEFILGIFKNNDGFVRNPKCDLEHIAALNGPIEERKKQLEEESLAKKLLEETKEVPVSKKKKVFDVIKNLFSKDKDKSKDEEGR